MKKPKSRLYITAVSLFSICLCCVCALIIFNPSKSSSTPTSQPQVQEDGLQETAEIPVSSPTDEVVHATTTPETTRTAKEWLDEIANQQFSDQLRKTDLSLEEGINTALTEYDLGIVWDETHAVWSVTSDFIEVAPQVFQHTDAELFIMRVYTEFEDAFGKESVEVAFEFGISRTLAGNIVWSNFDRENLAIVLNSDPDSYLYVHPALRDAWFEDQEGYE